MKGKEKGKRKIPNCITIRTFDSEVLGDNDFYYTTRYTSDFFSQIINQISQLLPILAFEYCKVFMNMLLIY